MGIRNDPYTCITWFTVCCQRTKVTIWEMDFSFKERLQQTYPCVLGSSHCVVLFLWLTKYTRPLGSIRFSTSISTKMSHSSSLIKQLCWIFTKLKLCVGIFTKYLIFEIIKLLWNHYNSWWLNFVDFMGLLHLGINSLIIEANSQNNVPMNLWIIDNPPKKLDLMNSNDSTVNNLKVEGRYGVCWRIIALTPSFR